jgi:hypothetical protein
VIDTTFAATARSVGVSYLDAGRHEHETGENCGFWQVISDDAHPAHRSSTPWSWSSGTTGRATDKWHCQAFADQDLPNISAIDIKLPAFPTVVALFCTLGPGLA